MTTREEFDDLLHRFAREWHGDIWAAMPGSKADDLRSPAIRAALLATYDAQAQTIKALEAGLREITELRPVDALGSAVERAQAIAHIALKEAGL